MLGAWFGRPGRMVYFFLTVWISARHRVSARPCQGRVFVIFSLRSFSGSRSFRRAQDFRRASSGRFERALRGRGVLSGQDQDHAGGSARRGGQEGGGAGLGGGGGGRRLPPRL